jgi:putative transposase
MAKRRTAAQIQAVVAAVERDRAKGLAVADSCRRHGITEPSYYRWRQHTAADVDDATRRVKELAVEVERLKQLLAEVMLDNQMLRQVAKKKW